MDDDLTLDGNAAAGLLGEVLPFELTTVRATCAGCGAVDPLGSAAAYTNAPGLVVRCHRCQTALVRIARADGRYWLDARGAACLEISAG
jgi:hypothetical protein